MAAPTLRRFNPFTLKVIKVNVLPSNSTHRYEEHKGEHGILYFAKTIADVAISSHNITRMFSI